MNAGSPSRHDSSFTNTRPTPSSAATSGTGTSGVGAYPGRDRWNARASLDADGPIQSRAVGEQYHDIMRPIVPTWDSTGPHYQQSPGWFSRMIAAVRYCARPNRAQGLTRPVAGPAPVIMRQATWLRCVWVISSRTNTFRLPWLGTPAGLQSRHRQTVNKGAVMTMAAETPTIVLVHGAWADATGFDAEIRALRDRGYSAIGFGNPLRDLAGDAAYLAEFLRTLTGPIVLVGHSYGGNVISVAAIGNEQVRALVYLNGWMCDVGESQQQLLEKFEGSLVGPSIRPVPFTNPDGSEGTDLYLAPEAFREAFAADVDPETAAVMAAAQRPYAAAAFAATPSAPPAWNTLPCWYLLGTEDKAIPPALQRFMAERANATIVEVPASHVSFVSQPEAATQLILQAVEATAAAG